MKQIIIALLGVLVISFTACKVHESPPISGSINGIPAITLYGSSGNITDYILIIISTTTADQLISYEGVTYPYTNTNISSGNIYIEISPTNVVKGTLTTTGTQTILTVANTIPPFFLSSQYVSR